MSFWVFLILYHSSIEVISIRVYQTEDHKYNLQLTINDNDSSISRHLAIVYTREIWYEIPLSRRHFGDWAPKTTTLVREIAQLWTQAIWCHQKKKKIVLTCLLFVKKVWSIFFFQQNRYTELWHKVTITSTWKERIGYSGFQ